MELYSFSGVLRRLINTDQNFSSYAVLGPARAKRCKIFKTSRKERKSLPNDVALIRKPCVQGYIHDQHSLVSTYFVCNAGYLKLTSQAHLSSKITETHCCVNISW